MLKKVRKAQYMILQYRTYCNIIIILYSDLGIVIISYRGASGNSNPYGDDDDDDDDDDNT